MAGKSGCMNAGWLCIKDKNQGHQSLIRSSAQKQMSSLGHQRTHSVSNNNWTYRHWGRERVGNIVWISKDFTYWYSSGMVSLISRYVIPSQTPAFISSSARHCTFHDKPHSKQKYCLDRFPRVPFRGEVSFPRCESQAHSFPLWIPSISTDRNWIYSQMSTQTIVNKKGDNTAAEANLRRWHTTLMKMEFISHLWKTDNVACCE